jgi:hypothetical protein
MLLWPASADGGVTRATASLSIPNSKGEIIMATDSNSTDTAAAELLVTGMKDKFKLAGELRQAGIEYQELADSIDEDKIEDPDELGGMRQAETAADEFFQEAEELYLSGLTDAYQLLRLIEKGGELEGWFEKRLFDLPITSMLDSVPTKAVALGLNAEMKDLRVARILAMSVEKAMVDAEFGKRVDEFGISLDGSEEEAFARFSRNSL